MYSWTLQYCKVISYSQEKKIDFNKTDQVGNTPLHRACRIGHRKIVKLILDHAEDKGIDIEKRNVKNKTAEDVAKQRGHSRISQLFCELRKSKRKHGIAFPEINGAKEDKKEKKVNN